MGQSAKPTRQNRTITVDFHDETTYAELLGNTKAFVEFVLAFLLALESAKYRGAPLRHSPDRARLPAWNLHMKHSISTNCALC
jgi:hypothetical protein